MTGQPQILLLLFQLLRAEATLFILIIAIILNFGARMLEEIPLLHLTVYLLYPADGTMLQVLLMVDILNYILMET